MLLVEELMPMQDRMLADVHTNMRRTVCCVCILGPHTAHPLLSQRYARALYVPDRYT
jgi:hypothetical protein